MIKRSNKDTKWVGEWNRLYGSSNKNKVNGQRQKD